MENLPVRWYRHQNDHRTRNEELKVINRNIRMYNVLAIGDSMVKFLPIMGALSIAMSGARIQDLERKFLTGRDLAGRPNPDVIVIMAGTNDVGTCLEGLDESIHCFFNNIEAEFPNRLKIVIGVRIIPKHHNWTLKTTNKMTEDRKAINDALQHQTKYFENYIFKNPYKLETMMCTEGTSKYREINKDMYSPDGLHLSSEGKEALALRISKIITMECADQIKSLISRQTIPKSLSWYLMSREYDLDIRQGRAFFKGKNSLLSNFREFQITVYNKIFQTSEAAYQFSKAVFSGNNELAQAIQKTKTGPSAKTMAEENICPTSEWHRIKELVMEHITIVRILTDHDLRRFLINNRDLILVENTSNEFWARGRLHHGKNKLGKLLARLGRIANSEHELKTRLECTAIEIDKRPVNFYQELSK